MDAKRKRELVLTEFVQTEETYVRDLKILADTFKTPLQDRLSATDLMKIFSNVDMLIMFHQELVLSLKAQTLLFYEEQTVGATLLKYADFMKLYSLYCSNMGTSSATLKQILKVPPLADVVREGEKSAALRGLTISDFLIKPVQRVMKYPLLLRELIENTIPTHPDLRDLEAAQVKICTILDKINTEKRESEAVTQNQLQLKDLQLQIEDLDIKLADSPIRKFVQKSTITRILANEKQELTYFLFNDLLLVCKNKGIGKFQLKYFYFFNTCLVRPCVHRDFPEAFEILQMDKKDKIHKYGVVLEDKLFLIKYLQEATYTHTLHINHIVKVECKSYLIELMYEWFLEKQDDRIADLVFCFRLFLSPQEFLHIFENEYPCAEDGKDILLQFIDGLEAKDFEVNTSLATSIQALISQVQNPAVQYTMVTALKKARRSLNKAISMADFQNSANNSPLPRRSRAVSNADLMTPQTPPATPPRFRKRHSLTLPSNIFAIAEDDSASSSPHTSPPVTPSHLAGLSPPLSPPLSASPSPLPPSASTSVGAGHGQDMLKAAVIAQCITRRESKVLRAVRPQEILAGEGPNIDLLLELTAWTTRWISTKILSMDTPEKRGETIATFIAVAKEFREMHNYQGITEVLASLHSPTIEKLKDSWQKVPQDAQDAFRAIDELMSPVENYGNYREACRQVDLHTPIFPSINIFLADVSSIEVPVRVPGDINMAYVKQVSGLLRAFRSCQKNHHKLSKTLPWIYGDPILKDEELESLANMYSEKESPQVRQRSGTVRFSKVKRKSLYLSMTQLSIDATKGDWDRIMAVSEMRHFTKGELIMHEKGNGGLYLLVKGEATMSRRGTVLMQLGPGDFILNLIVCINPYGLSGITVVANSPLVELKVAKITYVKQLLETDLELSARFYKFIARLQDMITASLGYSNAPVGIPPMTAFVKREASLGDFFHLKEDEVVIKTYICKYRRMTGKLSVSRSNLFFIGKAFGLQKQKQIPLTQVAYVKALKYLEIKQDVKIHKFYFKTQQEVEEAAKLIQSLFDNKDNQPSTKLERIISKDVEDELNSVISTSDWERILKGTSNTFYTAGSKIVAEGDMVSSLFQVLSGTCELRKKLTTDGVEKIERIGVRQTGDVFGETSFLDPSSGAAATVIALTDTEICTLDYHFVTVLLGVYKYIAPKFYKYLALLVHKRLVEFEQISKIYV